MKVPSNLGEGAEEIMKSYIKGFGANRTLINNK